MTILPAIAPLTRILPRLVLAWCLLFCLFRGLVNTWLNLSPEGDEGSFVDLALNVAEGRGFVQSGLNPMRLQDGFFPPECGRQPLWPLLLSLFADRTPVFFAEGKLLMLAISLVAVAATYLLVAMTYGRLAAMLAALVLSVNVVFHFYFVQVVCEVPLGVLFFAAFMAMVWGFRDERWWPAAGALAGLAWLTKATVSILLITFLLTALIRDRQAALRKKFLWLLLAAFLITTSPWTIRNWRLFGNPFYDYNSANVFWLDSWHQFWQPYEPGHLPTLRTYVQTHTVGHAAARLFGGAKVMASQFPVSLTPMPTTLLPLDAQHTDLLGYTLLAVFGFGVLRVGLRRDATEPERKEMLFVLLLMAAFFVAFSWYSVAGFSVRFLIPLVFIMCAYIGRTLAGGLTWLAAALRPRIRGLAATSDEACATALGFGLAILLLGSTTYDTLRESRRLAWTEPLKAFHCEPGVLDLLAWVETETQAADVISYGPEKHLWLWAIGRSSVFLPTTPSVAVLRAYLAAWNVRYVIVDAPTLKRRPFLRAYFDSDPQNGMRFNEGLLSQDLPELTLTYRTKGVPSEYLVFRVAPSARGR